MSEFEFRVSQAAETFYLGNIKVEADSYEEAVKKVEEMSLEELEEIAENWELADDTFAKGDIEVYDKDDNLIN